MFKNRHLVVSLSKDPKDPPTEFAAYPPATVDLLATTKELVEIISPKIFMGIIVYVGADTLRKVIVKSVG